MNQQALPPLLELMERKRDESATRANRMRVVGLFAGIGGLELGLDAAGHETQLLCEIDPGARAVLQTRFPDREVHEDVSDLRSLPTTDLLVGGFPCQDLSQAGKTAGIDGSRSGLVGHVFRLLTEHAIPHVLLENVPFMLQLGSGRAMTVVVDALEELGYRWAYRVVDTRAFGIPQRRRRVVLFASKSMDPRDVILGDESPPPPVCERRDSSYGFYWTEGLRGLGWAVDAVPTLKGGSGLGIPSPPAIWHRDGSFVKPDIRDAERLQGFPSDWTLPTLRVTRAGHRWKLVGNAVTVDMARWVGDRIAQPSRYDDERDRPLTGEGAWPAAAWGEPGRRRAVEISEYPVAVPLVRLMDFLEYPPEPMSLRAMSGFLQRARRSTLRFRPGFLESATRYVSEHEVRFQEFEDAESRRRAESR
ncbi:MAG: DNA (cytosine-5-)-methyltransferase [Deltaproteobacteria bacterium]|nr:DNA (cytosine-5-)-methyltransferase [Deltaproteobacteria bacterium]